MVKRGHEILPLPKIAAIAVIVGGLPLPLLSAAQGLAVGSGVRVPFLFDFPVWLRFLVVAPLLIAGMARLQRMSALAIRHLTHSEVLDRNGQAILARQVGGGSPWRSWWAGTALIIIIFVDVAFLRIDIVSPSSSWQFVADRSGSARSWAGWWYLVAGLPAFQFVMLAWLWRYLLWCRLIWTVSRLQLNLVVTHPDRAGGLGYFGSLQRRLWIVLFGLEAFPAALIGQEITHLKTRLADYETLIVSLVVFGVCVILAPLTLFTRKLAQARSAGLLEYGALAMEYVRAFDRKWIRSKSGQSDLLIGSADIQSLADMGNSFQVAAGMRTLPCDIRSLSLQLICAAAAPYLPLSLFVLPLREIVKIVFGILF